MITHAEMSFIETRKMVQLTGAEMGHRVSNTRSKVLAQAIIDAQAGDDYKTTVHADPVGELVIRRVMAVLNGLEPEPI